MNRRGLFVTGTDTGVGKTAVTASIARCLAARGEASGVLKPLATGNRDDAERLREAVGENVPLERISPLCFATPAAPSVAARLDGGELTLGMILESIESCWAWWEGQERSNLLVEGVGGLLCPIGERAPVADLAVALDLPLLIVARRALGTLNHTLLTVEAARSRGLRVVGVVLSAPEPPANPAVEDRNAGELARFLEHVPILAELPYTRVNADIDSCIRSVDWPGLLAAARGGRER
jgi:dethiobiotin synthetase